MPNDFFEKPIGTVSVFNGPQPEILVLDTPGDEIDSVAQWLSGLMNENIKPHEIGVFETLTVRSLAEVGRVRLRAADKDAWTRKRGNQGKSSVLSD